MIATLFILGFFIVIALVWVYASTPHKRYSYKEVTKASWYGFEKNPKSILGVSNKHASFKTQVLVEDPNGGYYANGRKVRS